MRVARGSVYDIDKESISELEGKKWIRALYVIEEESIGGRLELLVGRRILDRK